VSWLTKILNLQRSKSRQVTPRQGRTPWDYTQAGTTVTPDTALTLSAVWRCTAYISQTIAALPWQVRTENYNSMGQPSSEVLPTHPVTRVLNLRTNQEMSAFTFREQMISSALNWGNGYAEIERDNAGRVVNLWFISPDRVEVKRDRETQEVYYEIKDTSEGGVEIPARDMLHLHGLGFDGLVGYSTIAYAARTLGLGIALDDYGSSLFGNGATPSGVLSHPGKLNKSARQRLRESWSELLQGPKKALKTVVLDEGLVWTPTSLPNDSAQFLESRKFSVVEIARWYGVSPLKLFDLDKSTYNNVEQINKEIVIDTLLPWIRRFEQEVNYKLLGNNYNGNFSKMEVRELLRGDPKSRGAFYLDLFRMAAISPNEIRHFEDMNPIDDGDTYFVQWNNVRPLSSVEELMEMERSNAASANAPAANDSGEDEEEDKAEREIEASIQTMMAMKDDAQLANYIHELTVHETAHG
jgi:HK97 family phage portal protein